MLLDQTRFFSLWFNSDPFPTFLELTALLVLGICWYFSRVWQKQNSEQACLGLISFQWKHQTAIWNISPQIEKRKSSRTLTMASSVFVTMPKKVSWGKTQMLVVGNVEAWEMVWSAEGQCCKKLEKTSAIMTLLGTLHSPPAVLGPGKQENNQERP